MKRVWNPGKTMLMVLMTIPFVYPFIYLVGTALKTNEDFQDAPASIPTELTFDNLSSAWTNASLGGAMMRSLVAVGIAVLVTVVVSAAGAFWFTRNEGRLANATRWLMISTMAIPAPVFIMPLFIQLSDLSMTDDLIVLGLVYAAWNASFGLYLMFVYLKGLPREVFEAAELDGATLLQQLRHVIVPLARPALVTLAVFAFIWSWSDLLISVVLIQDPGQRTLIPATALLADRYSRTVPRDAAGVVIAMLPMVLVFLAGQRALVRGILAGVGK